MPTSRHVLLVGPVADTWLTPGGDMQRVAARLNITPVKLLADPALAEEVADAVAMAIEHVEQAVGPIVSTQLTEQVAGGGQVVLSCRPSQIVAWPGTSLDDVVIVEGSQVVASGSGRLLPSGEVTYLSGWCVDSAGVPAWARTAALLIVRHIWLTQQGNAKLTPVVDGGAWLVPKQAATLLEPRALAPLGYS